MSTSLLQKIKTTPLSQLLYPVITITFFIVTVGVFIKAALFLSVSINRPFALHEDAIQAELLTVDLANYELISKRLDLPEAPAHDASTPPETPPDAALEVGDETSAVDSPEDIQQRKAALKITIFNSTTVAGQAAALSQILTDAGFTVADIGSQLPTREHTTVAIKSGLQELPEITELVQLVTQEYSGTKTEPLLETSKFDATIIIGKN